MRLAGEMRSGFFPCPIAAVRMATERLMVPNEHCSVLDPCCGEGEAIRSIYTDLSLDPAAVYAVEIDETRAATAKANLPGCHVLGPCSFFGARISFGSFGFTWLNPPFSHAYDGGRVELQFLERATPLLKAGGVIALVCPEHVPPRYDVQRYLCQWFEKLTVLPFPEEIREYDEVIVLGVKRKEPVDARWMEIEENAAPEGYVYAIPPSKGPRAFEKVEMTDEEVSRALAVSSLRRHLQPVAENKLPSPPLALGIGHVALLLASGHLDGIVRPPDEPPHLVRGTAKKVQYVDRVDVTVNADGSETTKTVIAEKILLSVRTVDVHGNIKTFAGE